MNDAHAGGDHRRDHGLDVLRVAPGLVSSAALLHVTGITPALSDSAHETVLAATEQARQADVPISFDVNHRVTLWRDRDVTAVYRELVGRAAVVFASEEEARLVVPEAGTVPELAEAIAALGPSQIVVKLGARGCYALIDGVVHEREAVPIQPVDTVGAFACLAPGDWEGLPWRADLARLGAADPVMR
jgi:2-dehydro-3-deoxygluconokinase